jgi:hypothetical protein
MYARFRTRLNPNEWLILGFALLFQCRHRGRHNSLQSLTNILLPSHPHPTLQARQVRNVLMPNRSVFTQKAPPWREGCYIDEPDHE